MNGYIQADILGKIRGLKFGTLATEQIVLELAKLNADTNFYNSAMIAIIVYWGLYNNSFIKREQMDYTFEDVVNWIEDNLDKQETLTEIVQCFEGSKATKLLIESAEEVKKKMNDSISKPKKAGKNSKPIS